MNLNSVLREMILRKRLATPRGTILLGTVGIAIILPSDHKLLSVQSIRHRFYKWKIQSYEYTPSPPWSGMCDCDYDHMIAVNFPALFFLTSVEYKARFCANCNPNDKLFGLRMIRLSSPFLQICKGNTRLSAQISLNVRLCANQY